LVQIVSTPENIITKQNTNHDKKLRESPIRYQNARNDAADERTRSEDSFALELIEVW
jgi:hypothetical protein